MTDKKEYKILIVEDNPGDFTLIEDFLFEQIASPHIVHAENFAIAKKNLSDVDSNFNVILLDLSLPDINRKHLITEVMALCGNIPVIVLTGYIDFEFSLQSLSQGIADYILKEELTSILLYKSIVYSSERKKVIVSLERQNEHLKDIAWMQSHTIRAPLARLMGLVTIIAEIDLEEEERRTMLQHVMSSAKELDCVIKAITTKTAVVL